MGFEVLAGVEFSNISTPLVLSLRNLPSLVTLHALFLQQPPLACVPAMRLKVFSESNVLEGNCIPANVRRAERENDAQDTESTRNKEEVFEVLALA